MPDRLKFEAERAGLCNIDFQLEENWFDCQLPADHEGQHMAKGDVYGQEWEMTWD